ncbi:hypothetical protein GLAREA_07232 [Glarea lozoyensis ATCC 20868]|uniref:Uncharacterized protein n=1 Tax=Glarea lozoyensis (strain ATCC 20868 / MF5171) TaxID=1116229 RepID=S3DAT2_GLAL2|nr:uncharacterized protein GLAREA_07232 [Glarea lozoyensis ATCC 20868]EPE34219.1 hypothetical protein GLAREA_07232 [Glarea lozoyensis ATCC 20868]
MDKSPQQQKKDLITKLGKTGGKEFEKDVQDLLSAKPSEQIIPRLWTRTDLMRDFRKELEKSSDGVELKATFFSAALSKAIEKVASGGAGDPTGLIDQATDFVLDTVQKRGVGEVVGYVVQKDFESKAARKAMRSFGTKFILMSIALAKGTALTPAAPVGMIITYILYLHEAAKEKQDNWNKELAKVLDERLETIRANAQAKLDAKHETQIRRFLLSNIAHETEDSSPLGKYKNFTLSIGDAAQIRDNIRANLANAVTNADLILIASQLGLKTSKTQTLTLTEGQIEKLNAFAQDIKDADFHIDVMDEKLY